MPVVKLLLLLLLEAEADDVDEEEVLFGLDTVDAD